MSGPGEDLVRSATLLLVMLGRRARQRLDEELAADGLSVRHLGALGHLSHSPGLSFSELARRGRVTVQSMHATVRQLEAAGAVRRGPTAVAGQSAELEITDSGRRMLRQAAEIAAKLDGELLAVLPAAEREATRASLERVVVAAIVGGGW